jgi:hypothetical protein
MSSLLDQHEDVGEGRFIDVVLWPNPRSFGHRGGGGGSQPPS